MDKVELRRQSMNKYAKFSAMIATSTAVMLGLMYLNTYQFDHVYFSETRAYMALVMVVHYSRQILKKCKEWMS